MTQLCRYDTAEEVIALFFFFITLKVVIQKSMRLTREHFCEVVVLDSRRSHHDTLSASFGVMLRVVCAFLASFRDIQ